MSDKFFESSDYSKFKCSPINRDPKKLMELLSSMKRNGFSGAFRISVWPEELSHSNTLPIDYNLNTSHHFIIDEGNRRFTVAQKLGIPLKCVIPEVRMTNYDINITQRSWDSIDWLVSKMRENDKADGNPCYAIVYNAHIETGIPLRACASMLAGASACAGNYLQKIKNGTYRLGDPTNWNIVSHLILFLKPSYGWITNVNFVNALSKVAWVGEFDLSRFKEKVMKFPYLLDKQRSKQDYIEMIERIYNYKSRDLTPLAVRAEEEARKREAVQNRNTENLFDM